MKFETSQDYGAELLNELQKPLSLEEFGDSLKDTASSAKAEVPPPKLSREITSSGKEIPSKIQRSAAGHFRYPENSELTDKSSHKSKYGAEALAKMQRPLHPKPESLESKLKKYK